MQAKAKRRLEDCKGRLLGDKADRKAIYFFCLFLPGVVGSYCMRLIESALFHNNV